MPTFALIGGYTAESWKAMADNGDTRTAAAEKVLAAVGGSLRDFYWSLGEDDFMVIFDAPTDAAAAALGMAVAGAGRLRNTRTIKLFTTDQFAELLTTAKSAAGSYTPPGARQPAGVN